MPDSKGYEFFEHTADVGIRAHGKSPEELFIHAAQGLIELLVEHSQPDSRETHPIMLKADTTEELFTRWLKELLFWFMTDRFIPGVFHLSIAEGKSLRGWLDGERFDPARHVQGTEVKGITMHQLKLTHDDHGWHAEVIVDV